MVLFPSTLVGEGVVSSPLTGEDQGEGDNSTTFIPTDFSQVLSFVSPSLPKSKIPSFNKFRMVSDASWGRAEGLVQRQSRRKSNHPRRGEGHSARGARLPSVGQGSAYGGRVSSGRFWKGGRERICRYYSHKMANFRLTSLWGILYCIWSLIDATQGGMIIGVKAWVEGKVK